LLTLTLFVGLSIVQQWIQNCYSEVYGENWTFTQKRDLICNNRAAFYQRVSSSKVKFLSSRLIETLLDSFDFEVAQMLFLARPRCAESAQKSKVVLASDSR
jgi:hypothetical protein